MVHKLVDHKFVNHIVFDKLYHCFPRYQGDGYQGDGEIDMLKGFHLSQSDLGTRFSFPFFKKEWGSDN